MWMFNFWTKKQKEKIQNLWANQVQQVVNNMTDEQKAQVNQIAENTKNQNFDAAAYNKQARENWEADWQSAYRRDILNINDNNSTETEAEKKRRLFQENQAKQEAEYQKRIAEDPNTSVEAWLQNVWDLNRLNISQEAKNAELARRNWQANQTQTVQNQSEQSQTVQNPVQTTQNQQTTNPEQNQTQLNQNNWVVNTVINQAQTAGNVDYNTWDVAWWKSRGSSKEELENAIEKKYWTVANWKSDWSLEAVINGQKFKWNIDANWNPEKTNLWSVNQTDIIKNQVSQMIQNWNTIEEINDYVYKNNLQDDLDIKNQLKQKYISDYEKPILQKYRNLSLQDLHKAVKNGEILPGTEVFNKLPQAEAYNQYQKSFAIIDAGKDSDFSNVNSTIEIEKIVEQSISKFFDTAEIKDVTERWKNDPEIKQYRDDIYKNQKNIIEYKKQMKDIEKNVRARMWWASESTIQAEIAWQTESLLNNISTETALMNASLGMIWDRKWDFEVEMKMLGYKDSMKKEQYMAGLDLYKYDRNRMDEFQKLELQYKNQELAFNREQKAKREMIELEQKYKKENKTWAYQIWVDWSLNYVVDWVAQKVKFDDWKTLFTKTRWDLDISYKQNADWSYTAIEINKNTWNVNLRTFDIDWHDVWWVSSKVFDAISSIPNSWRQCWQAVNDYLEKMWWRREFGDSWESKKAKINSLNPVKWGIAVRNPAKPGTELGKYWHVGIVTGISPDWQKVYITDWNYRWDWKKDEREVFISEITWADGGFYVPEYLTNRFLESKWKTSTKASTAASTASSSASTATTSSTSWGVSEKYSEEAYAYAEDLWKWRIKIANIPAKSRWEVQLAKKELESQWFFKLKPTDEMAVEMQKNIDMIDDMLKNHDSDLNSLAWLWQMDYWFDSTKNDMINNIETLLAQNTLKTLIDAKENWATFGALSDTELEMLRASATRLWKWANYKNSKLIWYNKSEKQLKEDLRELKEKYERAYEKATWINLGKENNPAGL